jgi:signal transduction histidine kinase
VFATRRRLIAAFAALLAAFLSVLVFQVIALRRLEMTFADMAEHEQQMALALQLEGAVREQFAHEARFAFGQHVDLVAYDDARARALQLSGTLDERADEAEAHALLGGIREASAELDAMFRGRVTPAAGTGDPFGRGDHVRSYALTALVERSVDDLFTVLQRENTAFRRELVALAGAALRWTTALLVAIPLFAVASVVYLSRSIARPLARLSEGAAAIAVGDLEARIDIDSPDEFGALAGQFNAMTLALAQHHRRLVESEKLAGIGRLASGVAHELNNPLQVMLGYLSLNRDLPDRRLAGQLAAIEEEAVRCRNIVQDLLELSRPMVAKEPVDLRALCEDIAGGLRVSIAPRTPRLSVDGAALTLGDGPRLRQAIVNLMRNAVEAAGPSGEVGVLVATAGEWVEVAVSDSGAGIAPETRARMFEPFFTTKPTGTGLGLAVSRAIALAHGGDIEVGDAPSGGAVFTLRLARAFQVRC